MGPPVYRGRAGRGRPKRSRPARAAFPQNQGQITVNSPLVANDSDAGRFVATDMLHWCNAWGGLGIDPAPERVFDELLTRYHEAHRAYHTREHLEECLVLLDEVWGHCDRPEEVAIALWFHDAIYEPHRSDNEAASAKWLATICSAVRVAEPSIERMQALVLATRHAAPVDQPDAKILVDIDLSILGAPPARFDAYEGQIRREYRWVPSVIYRSKRANVLNGFLRRHTIYATSSFQERFEEQARMNIARSLSKLD
jgi:predicted metal-dependent HD superfamily phosphohydrolase